MKSVMLYFGSFNPVHNGHIAIAEWILEHEICNELWFVVSPQNPLKPLGGLIGEQHRLEMVKLAISDSRYPERMRACDIEFEMPKPSYTIDTLTVLSQTFPNLEFSLLVGSDIVEQIEKWKDWKKLLNNYKIYVYPRRCYVHSDKGGRFILLKGAPYKDFSSTEVREALRREQQSGMMPTSVGEYIKQHKLWKTETI